MPLFMHFYHARRFHSALVGTRLREVTCEKCSCRYVYEFTRIGSGTATAPYGIGCTRAARIAAERAQRDLDHRLESEAELVPCPKCHWINDELIMRYRQGCYRRWARSAAWLGIVGTVSSLVGSWFVSIGPAIDHGALPYLLIGGPSASMALAASILLLRHVLRQRIRPNRDYPLPPAVPRGSPVPLIRNAATGELEPATLGPAPHFDVDPWTDYQVGRSTLPRVCCACLAPCDLRSAYRRPLQPAVELVVPLCRRCGRRWLARKWFGALLALSLTAAVGLPVLFALKLDEIVFWLTVAGFGTVMPIVGAMLASHRTAPVVVKIVDGSRGVVCLWFRNKMFRERAAREHSNT
jgi:hypothetical protein